jgi:hypothetical protein
MEKNANGKSIRDQLKEPLKYLKNPFVSRAIIVRAFADDIRGTFF